MKSKFLNKYLPLALSALLIFGSVGYLEFYKAQNAEAAYAYSRTITIAHGQVGNGTEDESNFTVLVCANATLGNGNACPTVSGLNQTGGGAHVQNANGYDIVFSTTACTSPTLMNWEMEKYVASTGEMEAWVLITPTLSHTSDTVFYMCYGNSGISTFQGGATGTAWNSSYAGVYHLPNGTTLSYTDSTGNYNGTPSVTPPTATSTGEIDGAASFNGSNNYVTVGTLGLTTTFTFSTWIYSTAGSRSDFVGPNGGGQLRWLLGGGAAQYVTISDIVNIGSSNTNIPSGAWAYATVSYDGTTFRMYLNGTADGTLTYTYTFGSYSHKFGGDSYSSSYYKGIADEFRASNIVRSAGWIKTEYNNESSPSTFETFGSETSGGVTLVIFPIANLTIYKGTNVDIQLNGNLKIFNNN